MRWRDEGGASVVELAVAAAVTLSVLAALGTTLISGLRTTSFGSNQSVSLDAARLVLNQVQRDLQGSKQFENCTLTGQPAGSCILVVIQPPAGPDEVVRYRLDGTSLFRDRDDGSGTFPASRVLTERLANGTTTPLFACSNAGSLLQIGVNMVVQPNPVGSATYSLQTLVRPRNTYQPPAC